MSWQIDIKTIAGSIIANVGSKIVGDSASGATDSGSNPVKVGGVYHVTLPTLTDGQRGDIQLDTSAIQYMNMAYALDYINDSISAKPYGNSYTNITTNTTTVVKSAPGTLSRIRINNPSALTVANLTVTIYDNTAASGTKIATITVPFGLTSQVPFDLFSGDVNAGTGITVVTAGPTVTADLTVEWS